MRFALRFRWLLLCLLAALPVLPCAAQPMQLQAWTTEEGLPQNSVHALLQTPDGYLWLATENGVARFNGTHFRRFSSADERAFSSDDVCCIAQDASGALFFGTANGVVLARGDRFAALTGVRGDVLALERAADGAVLVLTDAGLFRAAGESVSVLQVPGGATATVLGHSWDGTVLVAAGTQLLRYRANGFENAGRLDAVPLALVQTGPQQVWMTTAAAVELLDGHLRLLHRWRAGQALPGARIESLQPWKGGVLVGGSRGAAVLRAGIDTPEAVTALNGNAVLSALIDREGDEWFGTDSAGLMVLRQRFVAGVAALAGESVTALTAGTGGRLWVGTRDAGLQELSSDDGGHGAVTVPGLASQVVLSLAAGTGNAVWVGSPEGLNLLHGDKVRHWTAADGLPDDFVRSLLADADGTTWVGTRRGLARLRDRRVERTWTAEDGLPSEVVSALLRDQTGRLWIGTAGGLAHLSGTTMVRVPTAEGKPVPVLSLLQTRDGELWAGTSAGLYVVSRDHLVPAGGEVLRTPIAAELQDEFGNLWLRTPAGLVRVAEQALRGCVNAATCSPPVRQFGVADGMPGVELPVFGSPIAAESAGQLWFATRRGVARVTPGPDESAPVAPGVAVEELMVDGRPVQPGGEVKIGAAQRRLAATFVGLSLRSPGQLQYRYRLRGFDREWSAWTREDVADYTNLPPGNYLLQVQARNVDGVVSSADAEVTVRVAAPLYRRWWFYLCVAGVLAAVWYGLYRLRIMRVQRDYEAVLQERNRIAREIHDTLAQDFVAVSLQLEVTAQLLQAGAAGAAQQQIDATRTLVRDGIEDARTSIWALRAGDAGQTLPARLGGMVQRVAHASLLVTGAYRRLPPSRERELFRIGKEAVGNADRHAHAEHIAVELIYSEDAVLLRVSDDGAGFDAEKAAALTGHYGVRGMQERAAAMGAVLHIQSTPGLGAVVAVTLRTGTGE